MELMIHIIFGLAIYPIAFTCYVFQNRLTFHISSGLIQTILLSSIVYWGFRVGLVILWIYLGLLLSDSVGLNIYDTERLSSASEQLAAIYLFVWLCVVVMLAIKAHLEADRCYANERRFKKCPFCGTKNRLENFKCISCGKAMGF
jgi:hypothetical protein